MCVGGGGDMNSRLSSCYSHPSDDDNDDDDDRCYLALFSPLEQTHCAHM